MILKFSDCPCQTNCPNGCVDCSNPICNLENVDVLVLNSHISQPNNIRVNQAMIVDFNGKTPISNNNK